MTLSREELLANFFNHFQELHDVFVEEGFAPFEEEYIANWLHSGQEVMVERRAAVDGGGGSDTDASQQPKMAPARIVGISPTGNLTVQFVGSGGEGVGAVEEVIPDTSSLNMLEGLVTRKEH